MKIEYEVVVVQQATGKARVIHEFFDTCEEARLYANYIACFDDRTVSCSIYRNGCLVMDVL